MPIIRIINLVCVLSLTTAATAQQGSLPTDTVLWSDIDKAVRVGNGSTIVNSTAIDRTIFTYTDPRQYILKYNGRDTTMLRTYITLSTFMDRLVYSFVVRANGQLTIFPHKNSPPDLFFFISPFEVPEFAEGIKLEIISSYIEATVCGMVLIMLLYVLGKYAQLRTQIYLYYSFYLLFTLLFLTIVLFYYTQNWLQMPLLRGFIHHAAQAASHACYFQFVRHFIQTRQHQPFFDKLLNGASIISAVYIMLDGIAMLSFPDHYSYRTVWDAVQVFYLIFGISSFFWIARSPTVLKNYLIIGTTALLIGGLMGLLVLFMPQWIENLPIPLNIQVFYFRAGILIEIVSFSLGLGYMQRLDEVTRAQAEARLEQEHMQVLSFQELDSLKTKFFSNITHEFRTPLTLIQGPANELYEREKNPEARRMLGLIRTNSDRLIKLINQLLDLAKLDAQEMKLNLAPLHLTALVKTSTVPFTSLAASKGIDYEINLAKELPVVMADVEKMEVIFSNLISNAIKFTPGGGRVSIHVHWEDEAFTIRVHDTGRGIPPETLAHIFDRFYQVNPTDSTHSEGTGIGLSLVKEYTELMRGVIEVESTVGIGTMFNIKLPLLRASATSVLQSHESKSEPIEPDESLEQTNGQQPLLLLVEDHDDIRYFIKTCLGNRYRYREARHGKEGLAIAHQEVPDIIISDWMMPEMDGVELCRQLKKDKRTDHVPFIMLTAKADQQHKLEGLQTGADDYLVKPFNKEELILKVQNLVILRDKLQSHIRSLLLAKGTPIEATSAEEKFIVKAKTFVEVHMAGENLSVEALAAEMALSREQCYRKITALSGLSPSAFIRKLRLQKAAQLLAAKSDTVSQIAFETGFGNLSHFSKAFKEEFGKLPSEFGQARG